MREKKFAIKRICLLFLGGLLITAILFGTVNSLSAAEIRISEEPVSPAVDYNILLFRNLRLSLTGVIGLTYDDNINRSRDNAETGIYTTPRLRMGIDWPLTPNIHLGTSTSLGYRYYLSGDGRDRLIVSLIDDLATSIKADIHIGESRLRLSNRFSRSADDLEIGRITARDYVLNRNTFGARYTMPLTPVWIGILEASRRDTWTSTDEFEYHNNVRHMISLTTMWQMNPQFQAGPYISYEDVDYTSDTGAAAVANNDREVLEGGLGFLYRFAQYNASLEGNIGYQDMDIGRSIYATEQADGIAGRLAARFSSSPFTDHTLSVTHNRNQDIVSPFVNYSRETTYMYALASNIMRDLTLRGDIALVDIKESDFGEDAEIWRLGLGASYALGPQTTARVRYEHWDKSSDIAVREYNRNRVSVFLEYDF